MKKRISSFLMALVIVLSLLPATAFAAEASGELSSTVSWELSGGTLTISGNDFMPGYSAVMNAPWYDYRASITKVVIADGMTSIGSYAFNDCANLAEIDIADSVTSIGHYAFYGCANLKSITLPKGLLTNEKPEIGQYVFAYCTGLESIVIPEGIVEIDLWAFDNCTSLKSITLPTTLKTVTRGAFNKCTALEEVRISDLAAWCSMENDYSNPLSNKNAKLYLNGNLITDLVVPAGLDRIGASTFHGYAGLKSVTIPEGVTSIGKDAFYGCANLEKVTIPASMKELDLGAFAACSKLTDVYTPDLKAWCEITFKDYSANPLSNGSDMYTDVANLYVDGKKIADLTFPKSVTSIGNYAFYGCTSLQSVVIPDTVTSMGKETFYCCRNINSVTLGKGMTSLPESAFAMCDNLASIVYPEGYTSTGSGVFYSCDLLKSVTLPSTLTTIDGGAFANCQLLPRIDIPAGVTSIGAGAFSSCISLTEIKLPSKLTELGYRAFSECYGIKSIVIPDSITTLNGETFYYCFGLTDVKLPKNLTTIGDFAFYGCGGLCCITIPATVTKIGENAFGYCENLHHVLFAGTEAQWDAITLNEFYNATLLSAIRHYNCTGKETTVTDSCLQTLLYCSICDQTYRFAKEGGSHNYVDGICTVCGDDITAWMDFVWSDYIDGVSISDYNGTGSSMVIPAQIEGKDVLFIEEFAFYGDTFSSVTIPATVEALGNYAFCFCTNLTNITFCGDLPALEGDYVFEGVTATVHYPCGNKTWFKDAFRYQENADLTLVADHNYVDGTCTGCGDTKVKLSAPVPKIYNKSASGQPYLYWDKVEGAAKYYVYRATSKTGTYSYMYSTTGTSYTNTSAEAGKTYYYKVVAVDANGNKSDYSVVKSITCDLAQPVNTKITVKSDSGKPYLTWDAVKGATGYEIWRATSSSGTYTKMYTTSQTYYTNTSAKPSTTYYYKVCAVMSGNSYATSAFSATRSITCDCAAPSISITVKADSGKPYLTWKAVDGAIKYEVYRATSKDGTYTKMYTTSSLYYTNTSAKPGTTYYYKIKALGTSSYATSAFSNVRSITCDCAKPVVTITTNSSGKPYLDWANVDGAVKYEIWRATSSSGTYTKMWTTTSSYYTNTGAVSGTTYYYKVRALGSSTYATGAFSSVVSIKCK